MIDDRQFGSARHGLQNQSLNLRIRFHRARQCCNGGLGAMGRTGCLDGTTDSAVRMTGGENFITAAPLHALQYGCYSVGDIWHEDQAIAIRT